MNTKVIAAVAVGIGVLLVAGAASAEVHDLPPPEPEPDPDDQSDPIPPTPPAPPKDDDPPNISKDAKGYNSLMFKSASHVRQWFVNMGYSVLINQDSLIGNRAVKKFQRNYNTVAARPGKSSMGHLDIDGTAGPNTLNALEIAFMQTKSFGKSWNMIVSGG
jgi:hypothetical protein